MKKRIISLILAAAMLLSLTSCSNKEKKIAYQEGMTLEEYIDKVELPENLTISIDPATVEERETVKVYDNVKYTEFDLEAAQKLLLHNPVTQVEEDGEGWFAYTAETDTQVEYLGGDNNYGYLYYRTYPDSKSINELIRNCTYPSYPFAYTQSLSTEHIIAPFRGIYQSADKELDFASRSEISEQATTLLNGLGIPEFEIHEIVAYDTAALEAAVEYGPLNFDIKPEPEVQKSDEHYWVLCRQLLDGIPINTYEMTSDVNLQWVKAPISLQYTKDGPVDMDVTRIFQPGTKNTGTEVPIISAAKALECIREYYSQGILLTPCTVEEMELVYIIHLGVGSEITSIRPYWLIKTSYQQEYPDYTDFQGAPLEGEITAYDITYFDAETGELFEGSSTGKPVQQ